MQKADQFDANHIQRFSAHSGALLIELLVGMTIMSILSIALAGYLWTTTYLQKDANSYAQAITLASERLDRVVVGRRLPKNKQEKVRDFTIIWHTSIHRLELPRQAVELVLPKPWRFATVSVEVCWESAQSGRKRSVRLTSGIPIQQELA